MTAIVTHGDAGNLHLPDGTVDLIVTSPPYFGLRSYQDGGEHYAEQIGAEATPAEYLDALMACTAEWMRVLKPGGSIFVNLGDKYAGGGGGNYGTDTKRNSKGGNANPTNVHNKRAWLEQAGVKAKSLMLLPQRYAIRCIDELGLILRAEIIWQKPNGLPESVTDRVRRSHEQVFHFVTQPRYYSAVDEIRDPHAGEFLSSGKRNDRYGKPGGRYPNEAAGVKISRTTTGEWEQRPNYNPSVLGKLPSSVWSIPTSPLRVPESLGVDHFAAYPPELVRRIVLGWSPREVCTACGEGRRPVAVRASMERHNSGRSPIREYPAHHAGHESRTLSIKPDYRITGYACACPDATAPATPGVVLDPFGGTGTTSLVASVHGRVGISVDLSADYCRLAQWRTTDEKQRAKAAGMKPKAPKKPKPVPMADVLELPIPEGQLTLLDEETA